MAAPINVKQSIGSGVTITQEVAAAADEGKLAKQRFDGGRATALPVKTDGIASRTLAITLRRNALVERFDVVVQALQADATVLANCAQVRVQSEDNGIVSVVADFGLPRTVSTVGASGAAGVHASLFDIQVFSVTAWTGMQFADSAVYAATIFGSSLSKKTELKPKSPSTEDMAIFPDVRTERLLIKLLTDANAAKIAEDVWVRLPDLPADLDLRIDGGPPVWTSPGAAQPGARGFNAQGRQTVALGPALAKLTGDLTTDAEQAFQIVLTSRVPGRLELDASVAVIKHLARVDLGAEGQRQLPFDAEGLLELTLPLPSWVDKLERVQMTLTAKLAAERVIPPLGPPAATVGGGAGQALAELVLDPDHAAVVRLPARTGLVDVTAVRLPLRAMAGGAEVRVGLLGAGDEPGTPIPGASSAPGILSEAPATGESWTTFAFPRPVPIDPAAPPWAAVLSSRGAVAWTLARYATPEEVTAVRRGPPTGPWRPLPALLSGVPTIGGRIRVVGHASEDQPVAPLLVNVQGVDAATRFIPATPTAKGARLEWRLASDPSVVTPVTPRLQGGSKSVVLQIISRVPGVVTVRDVDVVATRVGA